MAEVLGLVRIVRGKYMGKPNFDLVVKLSLADNLEEARKEWVRSELVNSKGDLERQCYLCGAWLKHTYRIYRRGDSAEIYPVGKDCVLGFADTELKNDIQTKDKGRKAEKRLLEKELHMEDLGENFEHLKNYLTIDKLKEYMEEGYFVEDQENNRDPESDYRLFEMMLGRGRKKTLAWAKKERILYVLNNYIRGSILQEFDLEAHKKYLEQIDRENALVQLHQLRQELETYGVHKDLTAFAAFSIQTLYHQIEIWTLELKGLRELREQ